ncbi:major royal jelly protein [Phyllosticta capitalensis]|uniref:major royal jelly protein-domain-containing protein n=1 Tax=Phyllosticta capitalensis TaxID=121624 RepID=UPI00312F0C0F
MHFVSIGIFAYIIGVGIAQDLLTDPGVAGPALELVHLYYDQFPTGIAVSSTGRKFSNYPPGLDVSNTNTGTNSKYTVAELLPNNTEVPYPSLELNNPPGGAINYSTTPASGAALSTHLIGVQSVVIDSLDRLWILDTGRAIDPESGTQVPATAPGGPKLVGVDLETDSVFATIVFPPSVAPPDSYLNDVRIDARAGLSGSTGQGVAYITDSGADALVIVDLGTGDSWRRLSGHPSTRAESQFVPSVWGTPLYGGSSDSGSLSFVSTGADGIALSADGSTLYFCPLASRALYAVSTAVLRERDSGAELRAQGAVVALGQKGFSDGMESDDRGLVYWGSMEQNAVGWYSSNNGSTGTWVRDPRIGWVDTFSIAEDGYLYFTNNLLNLAPNFNSGIDNRRKPYSLFRVPLPDGGRKIMLR